MTSEPLIAIKASENTENTENQNIIKTADVILIDNINPNSKPTKTYIQNYANISGEQPYIFVDEYVEVEEKYCGPISCAIGTLLVILFWPASLFVGCCPCDKRNVKKKRVR